MKLVHLGIVIVEARGRVTPGLCFELRLSPGGRYAINLGHQLEAVHKSNCRRVSTRLNHDLHAIDATPARFAHRSTAPVTPSWKYLYNRKK